MQICRQTPIAISAGGATQSEAFTNKEAFNVSAFPLSF
jgi:hypothetical protein